MTASVSPMRIVHLISQIGIGGAETSLATLVESSRGAGVAHVVVSMLSDGPLRERLECAGAEVIELNGRPGPMGGFLLRGMTAAISKSAPDILQCWMYHANLAASVPALFGRLSCPLLWGIRQNVDTLAYEKPLTRLIVRAGACFSALPAKIVYNSKRAAEAHERLGYSRKTRAVIPNGVDCARFRPQAGAGVRLRAELGLPDDAPLIGRVARYAPMKDYKTLMRVFAILGERLPAARLLILGPEGGRESETVLALAARAGCQPQVHMLPRRLDIEAFYPALDVLVSSSSVNEGFPNTIAEALSCGVLVAATDVGEAKLIRLGAHRVAPPKDAPALATAIADLVRLPPEERRKHAARGRDFILTHFSTEHFAEAFRQIWREALEERRVAK